MVHALPLHFIHAWVGMHGSWHLPARDNCLQLQRLSRAGSRDNVLQYSSIQSSHACA